MENEAKKDFKIEDVYGSVKEIVTDKRFIANVEKEFAEMVRKRKHREDAPKGFRYLRDWYDKLSSIGQLNAEFLLLHIESIWEKESKLNSEARRFIQGVCEKALKTTLIEYSKLDRV